MAIRMQAARFEMKYLVNAAQIEGIRRYLRGRLVLDENNDPNDLSGYTVCSLYLDGPKYQLYKQTMQGSNGSSSLAANGYRPARFDSGSGLSMQSIPRCPPGAS